MEDSTKVCPVCKVKILKAIGGDRVIFSVGPAGTRATLWQRVCQHTKQPGCINQEGGTARSALPKRI